VADKRFVRHILRKIFLEDWGLKLLALAITLALWLGVTGLSTHSRRSMTVPLNTIISNDAIVTNTLRRDVEVVLGGDARRLEQLNQSQIYASFDLTKIPPGEWVIPLSPDTVWIDNLPQGITLDEVRPSNMAVKLDSVAEKDVVVRIETTGTPATGFEVYSTEATPSRIRVRGPANLMRLVDYVQTDKIDVAGKREGFTVRQIAVNSPNPNAAVLSTVVDVFVVIGERRIERSFSVPVNGEPGRSASFTIFAPRTLVQDAKVDDFKVEVFLDEAGEIKPRLILPESLDAVSEVRSLRFK
jgi:YbbR domain-containing protein